MDKKPNPFKEFFRKRIVGLKRKPHMIPLCVMAVAFLYYSLNLTHISDTTALVNAPNMGLAEFATMLFSVLSLVCFMNAFPHRKKVNVFMLALMFLMVAGLIYCDYYYRGCVVRAITREVDPLKVTETTNFIYTAEHVTLVHEIILIAGAVLVFLLPVYSKLLRKINTNVNIEGNSGMSTIDISGEDA